MNLWIVEWKMDGDPYATQCISGSEARAWVAELRVHPENTDFVIKGPFTRREAVAYWANLSEELK